MPPASSMSDKMAGGRLGPAGMCEEVLGNVSALCPGVLPVSMTASDSLRCFRADHCNQQLQTGHYTLHSLVTDRCHMVCSQNGCL